MKMYTANIKSLGDGGWVPPEEEGDSVFTSGTTQKARGVQALKNLSYLFGLLFTVPDSRVVSAKMALDHPEDVMHMMGSMMGGVMFVRPCPTRPRHGFVDSRVVKNSFQLATIARETLEADPEGELILMPYLIGTHSAIVTSANVTLGLGNDGATSGRDAVTLPLPTPNLKKFLHEGVKRADIHDDEDVYVELVHRATADCWYLTQLRAGPKLNGSIDYVPEDMTVAQVISPDGEDLLAWEQRVRELEPGTVVYHQGGGLASHFGVHCVINRVPYIVSFEPQAGQEITATKGKHWGEEEFERLALAIKAYEAVPLQADDVTSQREAVAIVLGGLHGLGSLMQSNANESVRAAAMAISLGMRAFSALCLGEARHAGANCKGDAASARAVLDELGEYLPAPDDERHGVYAAALDWDYGRLARATAAALTVFERPGWDKSYGGRKWATISRATLTFMEDVRRFVLAPTEGNAQKMLTTFNRIVNLAHNGGFWLNKLISEGFANMLTEVPVFGFVNGTAYQLLREPLKKRELSLPSVRTLVRSLRDAMNEELAVVPPDLMPSHFITTSHTVWVEFPRGSRMDSTTARLVYGNFSTEFTVTPKSHLGRIFNVIRENRHGDEYRFRVTPWAKPDAPGKLMFKFPDLPADYALPREAAGVASDYPELVAALQEVYRESQSASRNVAV